MTVEELRREFPELEQKVYGKPLVYLDNAATSLRPRSVVEKWTQMSTVNNANIYRAVHRKAIDATNEFEAARGVVAEYIGGAEREEVVFTSGTTASINLLAFSFGEAFVHEGDEIILTEAEHHADIVPWQMMCERKGAKIKVLPVDDRGQMEVEKLDSLISPRTKLVCVTHISNVLGIVNPIEEIIRIAHAKDCPVMVDGAQGIVHQKVDVKALDCDFYVFSGHKIFAATGTGILYGKRKWMEKLPPYMGGGEMIGSVKFSGTTYADSPLRFEAGTQNIAGVPTFVPALSLLRETFSPEIESNTAQITEYITGELAKDPDIKVLGLPEDISLKVPIFSFSVKGAHHEDLALILDKMGLAVRSGQQCAEPVMDRFGVTGVLRASFGPYNTMGEAEFFIQSLGKAIKMLR